MSLSLRFNDFTKGLGLWKFNNSLLYDDEYLECIRDIILNVKKQYAVPIYNMVNIHAMPDENISFIINDQLFLKTLLLKIRGKTIFLFIVYEKRKKGKQENSSERNIEYYRKCF